MKLIWLALLARMHFCMSEVKVEEITNEGQRVELGEGPHWDPVGQNLYYVDIVGPSILRYNSKNGEIYKAVIKDEEETPIGFMVPVEGTTDEFVVGGGRRVLLIRWDGKSGQASVKKVLAEVDADLFGNRINDGKVDPNGILFFGTMGDESKFDLSDIRVGSFYQLGNNSVTIKLKDQIGISNGLTWDVERKKFYYIDSVTRDVKVFDYDPKSSAISNESVLIDFNLTHKGIEFAADGMTIDSNGNLYIATWNGGRIIVVDPDNKNVIREISMPTAQITSLAFGGKNLDILYATSAGRPKPKPAPAGGLFKISGLGVKGLPMNNFKLF